MTKIEKAEREKIFRFFYEKNPTLKKKGISFKQYCSFLEFLEALIFNEVEEEDVQNTNSNGKNVINFEKAKAEKK